MLVIMPRHQTDIVYEESTKYRLKDNVLHGRERRMVMSKIIQLVGFKVGKEFFGVSIAAVKEIIRVPEITSVPDTAGFVEGVVNLRGRIVPVIDMRKRIGISSDEMAEVVKKTSRVLILELEGKTVGLIVDAASEILKISQDSIEPPPELVSSVGAEYITGVGKLNDRLIVLVDLAKLLSVEEIRKMEAMHRRLAAGEEYGKQEGKAKGALEQGIDQQIA